MSELFKETNEEFLTEGYKKIFNARKLSIDTEYEKKDLELKLKTDYATYRDFKNKKGELQPKQVKMPFIKSILKLFDKAEEAKVDKKKYLKAQEEIITNVLNSFEDNEENNLLFNLGVNKKASDLDEYVIYITDYLNGNLNNDLVNGLAQKDISMDNYKEAIKEAEDEMTGNVPKDEIEVLKELVSINIKPYKEEKEKEFNKANEIKEKVEKEPKIIEKTDLEKLASIVGVEVKK